MASERIQLLIDVVTGNSSSSLNKLKTDLKNAETGFGKVKVATSAAGDFIKRNFAITAVAAGAALTKFASKAIGDFENVSLGAGELRDKLGVTAEEASRLQEVAGDLGIPVDALTSTIGRLNRAAADTPEAFSDIGAAIAQNEDGTTDVNQTFLNTVDALNRIPDATQRASAAQKIFGRGWQQISELVGMGADELAQRLGDVAGVKIISDEEVGKAREFRDQMDELGDKVEEAKLSLGQGLLPIAIELAGVATDILGPFAKIAEIYSDIKTSDQTADPSWFDQFKSQAFRSLPGVLEDVKSHFDDLQEGLGAGVEGSFDSTELIAYRDNLAKVAAIIKAGFDATPLAELADETERAASAHEGFQRAVAHGEAEKESADAAQSAAAAHEELQQAYLDSAAAADKARQAAHDYRIEQLAAASGVFDYESNTLALADSLKNIDDATADYNDTVADGESTSADQAEALRNVRNAQIDAANQALATATAFADQSGAAEGTIKHTQAMKQELKRLADENPAIRGEIQQFIDKLNEIPPKKRPEVGIDGKDQAVTDADEVGKHIRDIPDREPKVTLDTGDAYDAANNFEARLAAIPDEHVNIIVSTIGAAAANAVGPSLGLGTGSSFMAAAGVAGNAGARVRDLFNESQELVHQALAHRKMAQALREQAAAATDADKKDDLLGKADDEASKASDLLEKARDKATRAADLHAQATDREAAALDREVATLRRHADALNAQADAFRERAASNVEAVDAMLQVQDAEVAAAEAAAHARRAFRVEGVSRADRAAAINDAKQAALALAEAKVQAARERAQRSGHRFTEADAERVRRDALREQARGSGPVAQALRAMIQQINFPNLFKELREAQRRDDKAKDTRGNARELERAANQMGRLADALPDVASNLVRALAAGRITDAEFDRRVHQALNRIAHAARAGRR